VVLSGAGRASGTRGGNHAEAAEVGPGARPGWAYDVGIVRLAQSLHETIEAKPGDGRTATPRRWRRGRGRARPRPITLEAGGGQTAALARRDGGGESRTQRRWRARLLCSAWILLQVLGALRVAALTEMAARIGLDATRGALLAAFLPLAGVLGACASLAVLLNRVFVPRSARDDPAHAGDRRAEPIQSGVTASPCGGPRRRSRLVEQEPGTASSGNVGERSGAMGRHQAFQPR